jgi:hypothetical protein
MTDLLITIFSLLIDRYRRLMNHENLKQQFPNQLSQETTI